MNKKELIDLIASETELSKKDVDVVITKTLETIKEEVKKGNEVKLPGFGSFGEKINAARTGINPATKEKIQIKESKSVRFKVSKTFKDYLN